PRIGGWEDCGKKCRCLPVSRWEGKPRLLRERLRQRRGRPIPVASSWRMPPLQPRASARSRPSACGLRCSRRPASRLAYRRGRGPALSLERSRRAPALWRRGEVQLDRLAAATRARLGGEFSGAGLKDQRRDLLGAVDADPGAEHPAARAVAIRLVRRQSEALAHHASTLAAARRPRLSCWADNYAFGKHVIILADGLAQRADVGVIKVHPGEDPMVVQRALRKALPATIAVFTKPELIEFERKFQAAVSSAGPIFAMGTIVGFVVGMLISYQVTYTDLADQLPQYATLKAIGYKTSFLFRVVLEQPALNALAGWIPAVLVSVLLYRIVGHAALLPLHMTGRIIFVSLGLTLGMCMISVAIAVGRVIKADPAEVF